MQAASGWAPLSHAPRFATVCICGCQRLFVCMWNGIRRRQGARLQLGTNRRFVTEPSGVARLSGRQVAGPLARETEAGSRSKGACGSEANCGLRATRGSEAGRAFGLYCANRYGRCACSGGQGRFPARGLLAVPRRFATWDSQRVSYIPWNQDGFRMPPMFGVK